MTSSMLAQTTVEGGAARCEPSCRDRSEQSVLLLKEGESHFFTTGTHTITNVLSKGDHLEPLEITGACITVE